MKNLMISLLALFCIVFVLGLGPEYGPVSWRHITGGIEYSGGNVNISNGTLTASGIISQGTDIYVVTKTFIKTFDIDPASQDDYQFDNTQVNITEQTIEIPSVIPAYGEIVSAQVRCIETVVSSGADVMAIDVGITDGGGEILITADTDTANDINGSSVGASPERSAFNAARSIWVNATPDANWNTISAGRWVVMVTYRDYGAVHTAKNP